MRRPLAAALLAAAPLAFAQLGTQDPDWKEVDAPPPPQLRLDKLVEIELPRTQLRYGIDPASISVGKDGIVRYVAVATSSSGAVNAMYEGIRCGTGEVKVYARHNPGTGWKAVPGADWRPIQDPPFRHSLYFARHGACIDHLPGRSAPEILRELKADPERRFITDSAR